MAAVVFVALATLAACGPRDGLPGAPGPLEELLGMMPERLGSHTLYYSDLAAGGDMFGTALPTGAGGLAALRLDPATQILETGEGPATALRGPFDADAVADAATAAGYEVTRERGWVVFRRPGAGDAAEDPAAPAGDAAEDPAAPAGDAAEDQDASPTAPVVAAVPAGAVRRDRAFLGDPADVLAVVEGGPAAGDVPWLARLARAAGPGASAVALGPPPDLDAAARRAGTTVDGLFRAAGVTEPLEPYLGFALAFTDAHVEDAGDEDPGDADPGDAEAAGHEEGAQQAAGDPGAVVLALVGEVDAERQARALALRAATGSVLGDRPRRMAELLAGGAPRVHRDAGVVVLPVRWRDAAPAQLRADLEAGALVFLVPGPVD